MTDSILLNVLIKSKGLKYGYIADRMNLSRAALYNKVNGKTEFLGSEISMLSDILNLSVKEKETIFFAKIVDA